jgi:large subunit ribosomal protein L29
MKIEKVLKAEQIRDWSEGELKSKEHEFADQLFRLKFQLASGQGDVLTNLRVVRKNLAKVKTIVRERELKEAGAEKA